MKPSVLFEQGKRLAVEDLELEPARARGGATYAAGELARGLIVF